MTFHWSEDRVEALKQGCKNGLSYSEIANLIGGISRNACIGKARRLGIDNGATKAARLLDRIGTETKRSRPHRSQIKLPGINAERRRSVAQALKCEPLPNGAPDYADNPVKLLDLALHHCRWPIGDPRDQDFHFCGGQKLAGCSYCARHMARSLPRRSAE